LKKQNYLSHSAIDVYFKQSKEDFVVTEIPLYEFSGEGEHLIVKIRKKDLSTWDMVNILSDHIGVKSRDIGYAGLKDKNAMTVQYISLEKKFEQKLESFEHSQIKILEKTYHNNKIRIGHLKGNHFFIRLKRVEPIHRAKLDKAFEMIQKNGMANYFGFQRFGLDKDNHEKGKQVIEGTLKVRNRKLKQMYINAYQSFIFNTWLSKRIEISKLLENFDAKELQSQIPLSLESLKVAQKQTHPFKILEGDVFSHYPYGRIFYVENTQEESEKFALQDRVPTGLLVGKKVKTALHDALVFEKEFIQTIPEQGSRRFAWVFPQNMSAQYNEEKNWYEVQFELPKGSYATELLSQLLNKELID
jgi:tRNA pseudouridine13 synthase